jgi:hypothetical protein
MPRERETGVDSQQIHGNERFRTDERERDRPALIHSRFTPTPTRERERQTRREREEAEERETDRR